MRNPPLQFTAAEPAAPWGLHPPKHLREAGPMRVQEVGPCLQGPAVVLSEQGPPSRGGVVLVG